MSAQREIMSKSRLEGYGTLLPSKWKEIYEHVDSESFEDRPLSARTNAGVPDQAGSLLAFSCASITTSFCMAATYFSTSTSEPALQILGETLRIARLRIKELEAETNIQTTELNRLKEYVNASESAGRTMYGQQVDELKQVSLRAARLGNTRTRMQSAKPSSSAA